MADIPFFVDFHSHPAMKAYGRSFDFTEGGKHSDSPEAINSLWHYDPPRGIDKVIQVLLHVAKFRQSDCRTLAKANCRLVFASLYPIEKGFFSNKLGDGLVSDFVNQLVAGVGRHRIDDIQEMKDYFADLKREYQFYVDGREKEVVIDGLAYRYLLVNSYNQVLDYMDAHPGDSTTVFIAMSIEGLHVLHSDIDKDPADDVAIMNNLAYLKDKKTWEFTPFFVSVAHHFNNHLCGHAESLFDLIGRKTDQGDGLFKGFSEIGWKVVKELLNNADGKKRIYVDIKHMSLKARQEYFLMLQSDPYRGEQIPIIVSHGAACGQSMDPRIIKSAGDIGNTFMHNDINFYDEEIVAIAKSGGIFALQLDERRLIDKGALKKIKKSWRMENLRAFRAGILWNQVRYIAELLDKSEIGNYKAWDCLAIGSDHDGIINPLNGYLTSESMRPLYDNINLHARDYFGSPAWQSLKPQNRITAGEIADRIFYQNADRFLRKWFV